MKLLHRAALRSISVASALAIGFLATTSASATPTRHGESGFTASVTGCDVYFYGKRGTRVCDTYGFIKTDPVDGTVREFIIGTDYAVWNIVRYPSGAVSDWRSLGGDARVGVDLYSYYDSGTLTISTTGTNGARYCDSLSSSFWTGFYRC